MIAIEGLNLWHGGRHLLCDVGLRIAPGEVLGLVGESGSGKSMTALAVMRLLPRGARLSGRIHLDGTDLTGLSERRMCRIRGARIGMVFQEPMSALNPLHPIGDQIAEVLRQHGAPRAGLRDRVRGLMGQVGLDPAKVPPDRYPHELSGGQRQRVGIAMAVALNPALLIADEPTTALDVTTQARILDLIGGLVRARGMACLFISHDLGVVARMADRIAVMQAGRIVETGPAAGVLGAPRSAHAQALLAAARPARHVMPAPPGAPLLELSDVTRRYPPRRRGSAPIEAVAGVSLTLRQGECLGLVGESGCGKSTLVRAILGLDPVQGGTIRLGGQAVGPGMPADLRRRIQVVFQDPYGSFNPRHKVGRLVGEPFHLTGRPPDAGARIAAALRDVGLSPEDAERYPHAFSGGQRQRIALARALVIRPDVIVLDEAVSALDATVRAQVLALIADLRARLGLSCLFVSHDLAVVRAVADRVAVMQAGRIIEEGATETVFATPRAAWTRTLLAAAPLLPEGPMSVAPGPSRIK